MSKKAVAKSAGIRRRAASGEVIVVVGNEYVFMPKSRIASSELKRHVQASSKILTAFGQKLSEPGVVTKSSPNVPTYRADPQNPDAVIRQQGKTATSGRFVDGKFRAR